MLIGFCDLLLFVTVLPILSLFTVALSDSVNYWILLLFGTCPYVAAESDKACILKLNVAEFL